MIRLEHQVLKKLGKAGRAALKLDSSLSEIFHENTKLSPLGSRSYGHHIHRFLMSPRSLRLTTGPYKTFTLMDQVDLPSLEPAGDVEETIVARRSCRDFTGESITKEELARLLYFSYGRTAPNGRFRPVASGGGLYPLELYVVPNNIDGLERWVYHYNVETHCLDVVKRKDRWPDLKECVGLQDMKNPDSAAMVLFVTAIFERSTVKYLDRGYRLILLEAGGVGHNLGLMVTALGLAGYLVGGFIDNALSDLLGIDGVDEAPILPIVVGRPIEASKPV